MRFGKSCCTDLRALLLDVNGRAMQGHGRAAEDRPAAAVAPQLAR